MAATANLLEPTVRVLNNADVKSMLEDLQSTAGSYEELLAKAEIEALSATERVIFRQMQRLKFLLK